MSISDISLVWKGLEEDFEVLADQFNARLEARGFHYRLLKITVWPSDINTMKCLAYVVNYQDDIKLEIEFIPQDLAPSKELFLQTMRSKKKLKGVSFFNREGRAMIKVVESITDEFDKKKLIEKLKESWISS